MADLGTADQPDTTGEHYRLIGDVPYLLVELRPEENGVAVEVSAFGIAAETNIPGIRKALNEILSVLTDEDSTWTPTDN
jgi:hypothetical protein